MLTITVFPEDSIFMHFGNVLNKEMFFPVCVCVCVCVSSSSLTVVCVSLGTYPGCQRKDCLSSFFCLPLLGASVLLGDRSVGGVT